MTGEREQTTGGRRNRLKILSRVALAAAVLLALNAARLPLRSSNALDELYYATVDSRCYDALELNLFTTDAILAALSPFKAPAVDFMGGVVSWHGAYCPTVNGVPVAHSLFGPGEYDLQASYDGATSYCCAKEALAEECGLLRLDWHAFDHLLLGDDGEPEWSTKGLRFIVGMPLSRFTDSSIPSSMEIEVELQYDLPSKTLRDSDFPSVSIFSDSDDIGNHESCVEYLEFLGIGTEEVADAAVQAIEEQVLPRFLARGGSTSRFSTDVEADGVTVNIDLSREPTWP